MTLIMYDYDGYGGRRTFPDHWQMLADVDWSEPYEVDQSRIYATPGGYALATATGCSCWEGDWSVELFDGIADLFTSIREDERTWGISSRRADDLMKAVKKTLSRS